jgi:hypothetical protein
MRRRVFAVLALLSLAFCLAFPILRFLGRISETGFRSGLLIASLGWFVFAPLWSLKPKKT